MSRVVVLDTGVLAEVVRKRGHATGDPCRKWMLSIVANGGTVCIPEIADYELRRELLRAGKTSSITRLDQLVAANPSWFLPMSRQVILQAAVLWAQVRQRGRPTAPDPALDGDVILAAHYQVQVMPMLLATSPGAGPPGVVATTNVGHLSLMVPADLWTNIQP